MLPPLMTSRNFSQPPKGSPRIYGWEGGRRRFFLAFGRGAPFLLMENDYHYLPPTNVNICLAPPRLCESSNFSHPPLRVLFDLSHPPFNCLPHLVNN